MVCSETLKANKKIEISEKKNRNVGKCTYSGRKTKWFFIQ
jgi:hypothetical protein